MKPSWSRLTIGQETEGASGGRSQSTLVLALLILAPSALGGTNLVPESPDSRQSLAISSLIPESPVVFIVTMVDRRGTEMTGEAFRKKTSAWLAWTNNRSVSIVGDFDSRRRVAEKITAQRLSRPII